MMQVTGNRVVSIRYTMRNSVGLLLEDTMNGRPVSYLHGSDSILALLQAQLEGCRVGDRKTVYLPAEPGITEEDFTFEVVIDQVREASPEESLLGYPVQLPVQPCLADCDCYKPDT